MTQLTAGELEDLLRGLFGNLIAVVGQAIGRAVVCKGETPLPDSPGRSNYASHLTNSSRATPNSRTPARCKCERLKGHNRDRFKRFTT